MEKVAIVRLQLQARLYIVQSMTTAYSTNIIHLCNTVKHMSI